MPRGGDIPQNHHQITKQSTHRKHIQLELLQLHHCQRIHFKKEGPIYQHVPSQRRRLVCDALTLGMATIIQRMQTQVLSHPKSKKRHTDQSCRKNIVVSRSDGQNVIILIQHRSYECENHKFEEVSKSKGVKLNNGEMIKVTYKLSYHAKWGQSQIFLIQTHSSLRTGNYRRMTKQLRITFQTQTQTILRINENVVNNRCPNTTVPSNMFPSILPLQQLPKCYNPKCIL